MDDQTQTVDIDKLGAGPELDALVAERVMGWTWRDYHWHDGSTKRLLWNDRGELPSRDDFCHLDETRIIPWPGYGMPAYSIEMSDAWDVHKRMCGKLFSTRKRYLDALQAQAHLPGNHVAAWPDVLVVLRDDFTQAICRAALKAVEKAR